MRVEAEPWPIPGQAGTADSKAVSYEVTVAGGAQAVSAIGHAFAVERRWRWILPPGDYEAYAAGRCPSP